MSTSNAHTLEGVFPDHVLQVRLDKALADLYPEISRTNFQRLISEGQVQLNGALTTQPAQKVSAGESYTCEMPPAVASELQGEDIPLDVVFEDDDVIVLHKPAGLVVHPAPGHATGTLVHALLSHCPEDLSGIGGEERPGIVHRLDKETSGLMIIAKNDVAHQSLSAQLADRTLTRHYVAFVAGVLEPLEGTISGAIGRDPKNRQRMSVQSEDRQGARLAVTHYKTIEILPGPVSKVLCALETGRTHQIRVHMASIGHPVLGDKIYGTAAATRLLPAGWDDAWDRHALEAYKLQFLHPRTGKKMSFKIRLDPALEALETSLLGGADMSFDEDLDLDLDLDEGDVLVSDD